MRSWIIFVVFICTLSFVNSDLVPHHVYLSLTGVSDSFHVTFTTSSLPVSPFAQIWETQVGQKGAEIITPNENSTFTFTNPNSTNVDYITTLAFNNLTLGGVFYSYQVCGDYKNQSGTCSPIYSFKSLPNVNDVWNIGFFGDLGSNATALINTGRGGLLAYAANYSADFIFHNGDLAYNLGSAGGANGNSFMTNIEPITSKIPYIVSPGNHEFKDYSDPLYYSNWFRGQNILGERSLSTNPTMWYSFDVGSVHIIAISTEVYCEDTKNLETQYKWLENDLQNLKERREREKREKNNKNENNNNENSNNGNGWIVVFGHRQMYLGAVSTHSSRLMRLGIQCTDSTLTKCDINLPCDLGKFCAYSLEQLLDKYDIDLFISGHVHSYARMFPIAPNHAYEPQNMSVYLNPQNPTYIISGAPGIQALETTQLMESVNLDYNVAKALNGFSYSHMQVFNSSHLFIKQIDVESGNVVDSFWIIKDNSPPCPLSSYLLLPSGETQCD